MRDISDVFPISYRHSFEEVSPMALYLVVRLAAMQT